MGTLNGRIPHAAAATMILAAMLAFLAVICCQTTDSVRPVCSRSDSVDGGPGWACTADLLADGSGPDRLPEPPLVDRVVPSAPAPAMRVPASPASPKSLPSTLHAVDSPLLC